MNRVSKGNGTATTTYPTPMYSVDPTGKKTTDITAGGMLVASIQEDATASSTDSGFKTTGTVNVATGWSNLTTTRLNTSDNSKATCSSTCDDTDDAQLSSYTFNVPSGATINGIEVKAEMSEVSSSGNIPTLFSLSWNNGSSWTSTKTATVDGTTDTNYTLGGSADTWGRTWTDTELSNANFRLRMDKSTDSDTLNVDYLAVKVYYTTSSASGTTTIQYIMTDHLGGTNVVTSNTGAITQVLDYYPFGGTRISSSTSGFDERKKFIGIERDSETGLDYALNRYYANTRGQFITQDPMFWGKQNLANPQTLNSYSYGNDNPITQKDPTGLAVSEYQPYSYSNGPSLGNIIGSYRGNDIYSRGSLGSGSPSNPYQCTVFANGFTQGQFDVSLSGNANNLSYVKNDGNTGSLTTYKNGGQIMPQENDIITWSGGQYGHVGVIAEVQFDTKSGTGYVYTAEQNWGNKNGLFVQTLTQKKDGTYSVSGKGGYSVQGWTRYEKNQNSIPSYTTTPATPASKAPIKKN